MENNVANRMVTLSVPVIKVDGPNMPNDVYLRENHTPGLYVFEDTAIYRICYFDGEYGCTMFMPKAEFEKQIAIKAVREERDNLSMLLSGFVEGHSNSMGEIAASFREINAGIDNLRKLIVKSVEAKQEGNAGNIDILAIAKACAVMQQPHLITELNKEK